MLWQNVIQRAIAKLLERRSATISREVRRSSMDCTYASRAAQASCQQRRELAARPMAKLHPHSALWRVVTTLLGWCWSSANGLHTQAHASRRSIPAHLSRKHLQCYDYPLGELKKQLIVLLRQSKSTRRPRSGGQDCAALISPGHLDGWSSPGRET